MKKFRGSTLCALLFLMPQVIAQEVVKNSAGEEIILNDDMTWEYVQSDVYDFEKSGRDVIGFAMMGDFEAALEGADKVVNAADRDMLLLNIWNFAIIDSNCVVQEKIVEKISDAGTKGLYSLNLRNLCPGEGK
ncbi:DUF3157 family protein [Halomonas sp. C05BenzN]|uniref:DUF3157 family protein n=1 Tax=Halomonas sp. C05BenzN TaxID=3411041 RepID=UPI003B9281D3